VVGVVICIALAYFLVVGAGMAGDLSDPGLWLILAVLRSSAPPRSRAEIGRAGADGGVKVPAGGGPETVGNGS
jgi:hypothetical protein